MELILLRFRLTRHSGLDPESREITSEAPEPETGFLDSGLRWNDDFLSGDHIKSEQSLDFTVSI